MRSPLKLLARAVTVPVGLAIEAVSVFGRVLAEADRMRKARLAGDSAWAPPELPPGPDLPPDLPPPAPPPDAGERAPMAGGAPNVGMEKKQEEPSPAAPAPDESLSDPSLFFNRELSWLDFNERVLELAEDESVPLLERVRFLAIYEDNLDEFFMVRVAGLHEQLDAKLDARGPDGLPPGEVIDRVRERAIELRERLGSTFEQQILPALQEQGIRLLSVESATQEELQELSRLFSDQIFAALTPLVVGRGRPVPYISNLSLSLAVLLRNPEKGDTVFARVKVPKELLRRFLSLDDGRTFVPLEQVIASHIDQLFPGMEIVEHGLFRVTRDTDYDISDESDDPLRAVEEEVRRRRFGEVVRVEIAAGMSEDLRQQVVEALKLEPRQVYEVEGLLGLNDLNDIADVPGFAGLHYPPWSGVTQPRLLAREADDEVDVFAAMREGDILVHHPYDSFSTSVERFVRQAVEDPNVLAIKQTIYRTSPDSPLIPSLIEATERGKQAVCLVELKARFDETANIASAQRLEESGVHVVYGIPGFKTHVKCVLVARREGEGVRHYVHIGTGNYNPKTARLYTDLGLFTADHEIGSDIAEMFNYLTGYARPTGYRKVLVAPFNLKRGILAEIEKTIEAHSDEHPARIRLKMNSLLDAPEVEALYRASQAGVEVQINVRGICALRPGVSGISDNIEVVSILGRFLEHSRIYSFERSGERHMYIGSADLMPRNLYRRVELVVPVADEALREQLSDILTLAFEPDMDGWLLGEDGEWTRRDPGPERRNMQTELMERHAALAKRPTTRAADSS
jgi:polyphosphate kinase